MALFLKAAQPISLTWFARSFAGMSHSVATGLNITKAGSDPPLKDDKDLPEWVWGLAQQERSLADLRRASQDSLDFEELRRLEKLTNREKIRTRNASKAK